jgi:3-isopropylmalate dehydrogenase
MEVILDPSRFGVIVTGNLFGDILSDVGAALQGGPGLAYSGNYNPQTGKGMFEPVHGSAHDIAGQDKANPMAALLSCSMMLEFLGFQKEAGHLEKAVVSLVADGRTTADLGGTLGTRAVGDAVAEYLEAEA